MSRKRKLQDFQAMAIECADQGLNNHVQQSVPNQDEDGYHVVVESTVRMENGVVQANLL